MHRWHVVFSGAPGVGATIINIAKTLTSVACAISLFVARAGRPAPVSVHWLGGAAPAANEGISRGAAARWQRHGAGSVAWALNAIKSLDSAGNYLPTREGVTPRCCRPSRGQ
jgi:hypothetical protein